MTAVAPRPYQLTTGQLRDIAHGYGDDATLGILRSAQLSKRVLLVRKVRDLAVRTDTDKTSAAQSLALLAYVGETHPNAATEVLAQPFVDTWAVRSIRVLTSASELDATGNGYLAGLAATAATRAAIPFEIRARTNMGQLVLPGLGVAHGLGDGEATLSGDGARLRIDGPDRSIVLHPPYPASLPNWSGCRTVTMDSSSGQLTVRIDDLDPYRPCFGLPVTSRLSEAGLHRLGDLLAGGWEILTSDYPAHATAVHHCLTTIVPIQPPEAGSTSASSRSAFGAIAASPTADAAGTALMLIHETMHMKLSALLDLVDLYDTSNGELHHAPWRADPRPVGSLLQGAYAHTGVADFWRVRRRRLRGGPLRTARFEFAYWLEQTRRAVDVLAGSGALTDLGTTFVQQLGSSLDSWASRELDSSDAAGVATLVDAAAIRWRLDNHRSERGSLAPLVEAWHGGAPCPPVGPPSVVPATTGGAARVEGLAATLRARLHDAAPGSDDGAHDLYLNGDPRAAVVAYSNAISAAPESAAAWVDLALAVAASGEANAARVLARRPSLVRDVVRDLKGRGFEAAPVEVANWLSPALGEPAA